MTANDTRYLIAIREAQFKAGYVDAAMTLHHRAGDYTSAQIEELHAIWCVSRK